MLRSFPPPPLFCGSGACRDPSQSKSDRLPVTYVRHSLPFVLLATMPQADNVPTSMGVVFDLKSMERRTAFLRGLCDIVRGNATRLVYVEQVTKALGFDEDDAEAAEKKTQDAMKANESNPDDDLDTATRKQLYRARADVRRTQAAEYRQNRENLSGRGPV